MATPIDLDIQEGEQIAIVGDNAAGKSRLVEVIVGHYPLLQNEVQYCFGKGDKRLVSENLKYLSFRDSYGEQDGKTGLYEILLHFGYKKSLETLYKSLQQ